MNINKPAGKTSFRVVSLIKKLSGEKRVGHAGTLDPAATGVLPVCLGQGTRIIEFLMDTDKAYRAEIELGVTTDTYDAEGSVTRRSDASGVTRAQVEEALGAFRGLIQQAPPAYSALKYQGKPLYELARAGVAVETKSRPVTIYKLELTGWNPPFFTLEIVCSKGTYIRSLAHDLGQALGCGAHMKSLVRLRCGQFDIKDAVPLPQLEEAFKRGDWQRYLYPIDCVLQDIAAVTVTDDEAKDIRNGRPLLIDGVKLKQDEQTASKRAALKNCCRAYTQNGGFLGVLRLNPESGYWQPEKVFLN